MYVLQHGVSLLITRLGENELATTNLLQAAAHSFADVLLSEAETAKSLGAEDGHHEDSLYQKESNANS
ncbi:hypothetical protein [Brevibacterium permense]|uniref:hypothetical protein n=1 Tax=Brevibacterium permense TaxID=234834 RepID=UPI0021CF9873|nr:hypothetical protein [Brevibacterium permense]